MARSIAGLRLLLLLLPADEAEKMEWLSLEQGGTPLERYENRQLLKEADELVARTAAAGSSSLAEHVRPPALGAITLARPVGDVPTCAPPQLKPEPHHPSSQPVVQLPRPRRPHTRGEGSRAREEAPQGTQGGNLTFAEFQELLRADREDFHLREATRASPELQAVISSQEPGGRRGQPHGLSRSQTLEYRGSTRKFCGPVRGTGGSSRESSGPTRTRGTRVKHGQT